MTRPTRSPSANEPVTFTTTVPYGNRDTVRDCTTRGRRSAPSAPSAPANATQPHHQSSCSGSNGPARAVRARGGDRRRPTATASKPGDQADHAGTAPRGRRRRRGSRSTLSTIHVEKVVSPPQMPTATNGARHRRGHAGVGEHDHRDPEHERTGDVHAERRPRELPGSGPARPARARSAPRCPARRRAATATHDPTAPAGATVTSPRRYAPRISYSLISRAFVFVFDRRELVVHRGQGGSARR